MPNEEWGVKRICPTTGRRFYDLNKKPIISPYTGETVIVDANTRTRVAAAEKVEEVVEDTSADDADDLLADDEDDSGKSTDEDLLDDDDDDTVSLEEIADVPAEDEG